MNDIFKMNDRTAEFDPMDAKNAKGMGVLSYLGPLALIPYFAEKNSAWARFHAVQGINLLIVEAAVNFAVRFVNSILSFIPYVGAVIAVLLSIVLWAVNIGVAVLSVMGIVYAATDKAVELPVIKALKIVKK